MLLNFRSFVWFPIIFLILLPVGFFVCYGIAVSLSHVPSPPIWPYVSDTGGYPPESCIFTLLLTWGAFAFLVIVFTHYKYVLHHGHSTKCNKAALIVGFIIGFGITVVGSFQWTNALIPHVIGALAAFIGAVIYCWIIVYISWKYMKQSGYGKSLIYFRLIVSIAELISLILLIVFTALAQAERATYYNFSTISEWCLIYSSMLFVGSLIYETNNVRSMRTKLHLHSSSLIADEPNQNSLPLREVISKKDDF